MSAGSELAALYELVRTQEELISWYQTSVGLDAPGHILDALVNARRLVAVHSPSHAAAASSIPNEFALPDCDPHVPLLTASIDPLQVDMNVFLPPALRSSGLSTGVAGLRNMGNTCFVNSTLQCLMATDLLRNRVLSLTPDPSTPQPLTKVIEGFARLFWDRNVRSSTALATDPIVSRLPRWLGGRTQQDAQEFLIWLLDTMRDESKAVIKNNVNPRAVEDHSRRGAKETTSDSLSLKITRKWADTWIDEIMGNLTVSTVTCSECRAVTERHEANLMISLELPLARLKLPLMPTRYTQPISLVDCLDEYFNSHGAELIDEFSCLNCTLTDRVARASSAAESRLLERLPSTNPADLVDSAQVLLIRCQSVDLDRLLAQVNALIAVNDPKSDRAALFQLQKTLDNVMDKLARMQATIALLQAGDRSIYSNQDPVTTLLRLVRSLENLLVEIDAITEIIAYMHTSAAGGKISKSPRLISRAAGRKISLQHQPACLILHIKRFHTGLHSSSKLQHIVTIPPELDVSPYMASDFGVAAKAGKGISTTRYQLYGIIEHQGQLNSGHYIAYVLKPAGWYRCSDSHVELTTLDRVLRADAYMLFYSRF